MNGPVSCGLLSSLQTYFVVIYLVDVISRMINIEDLTGKGGLETLQCSYAVSCFLITKHRYSKTPPPSGPWGIVSTFSVQTSSLFNSGLIK